MNKKLIKIFSILVMVIMLSSIALNVFALSPSDITADSTVKGATEIKSVGKKVVGILQAVGVILPACTQEAWQPCPEPLDMS